MLRPEVVGYAKVCFLQRSAAVDRDTFHRLKFQARRRKDGVEHPLRGNLPTNATAGEDRIFAIEINAHADHELHIRTVIVGAPDHERHIKVIGAESVCSVDAGLRFDSNQKRISQLGIEPDDQVCRLQGVRELCAVGKTERESFPFQAEPQHTELDARR